MSGVFEAHDPIGVGEGRRRAAGSEVPNAEIGESHEPGEDDLADRFAVPTETARRVGRVRNRAHYPLTTPRGRSCATRRARPARSTTTTSSTSLLERRGRAGGSERVRIRETCCHFFDHLLCGRVCHRQSRRSHFGETLSRGTPSIGAAAGSACGEKLEIDREVARLKTRG
jgi:hypothetical protein